MSQSYTSQMQLTLELERDMRGTFAQEPCCQPSDGGVRHLSESLTRDSESVFPSNFSAVDNSQVAVVDGADHCDSKMASKSFATVGVPQILTNSVPENSLKGTSAQLPDAAKFASSQASTLPSSSSVSLGDDALVVLKRLNLEDSKQLVKLHRQFGHRRAERIIPILRAAGWDDASLVSVKNSLDAVQAAWEETERDGDRYDTGYLPEREEVAK